jgi:hypothetical protein
VSTVLERMFGVHELLVIDAAGVRCSTCGRVDNWLEHLGSIALAAMGAPTLPPPGDGRGRQTKTERTTTMNSTEPMTAGFPHGTKTGFEQGCKTNPMCSNDGITAQTCKDAATHYRSDFAYKKLVDGGMTEHDAWQQMFAEDSTPVIKPKPVARPKEFTEPIPAEKTADTPTVEHEVADKPVLVRGRHGSESHHAKGCRHPDCIAAHDEAASAACSTASAAEQAETEADAPVSDPVVEDKTNLFGDDFPETAVAAKTQTGIDETIADVKRERESRKAQADELEEAQQTNLQLRLELDVRTSERDQARAALREHEDVDRFNTPVSLQDHVEVTTVDEPSILTVQVMPMGGGHEVTMLGVVHPVDVALTIGAGGLQHVTIIRSAAA